MLNISSQAPLNQKCLALLYAEPMDIGTKLRQLRKANNLSGEKFGELCGVTKGMVSQWESGVITPPTDRLLELRKHLVFSFDWLLDDKPQWKSTDPRIAHVCHVMESLPPYAVDAGVREIDSLAELVRHIPKPNGTNG